MARHHERRRFMVDCPQCHQTVSVWAELAGRLSVDDDGASIRLMVKSKAVAHRCRTELNLTPLPGMNDDDLDPDDAGDTDPDLDPDDNDDDDQT